MSTLSDIWDGISGLFGGSSGSGSSSSSTGGSWFDRNWGAISKGIDAGRKLYNMYDVNDARKDSRNQYLDALTKMEAEDRAYQQQVAEYNAQRSGAASAARRQNEERARKAQAKALKVQQKFLNQMIANYQPYADAAKTLTPEMTNNYKQFLDTTSLFNQYLTPTVMKTLGSAPTPMAAPQVNPQAYTAPSKAAPVSFPTIEEMLKRGG